IADLQGPKIRLERFSGDRVFLEEGQTFTLDTSLPVNAGDTKHVGVTYKNLARDVKPNDRILVDDGKIILEVTRVEGSEVQCRVVLGGEVSSKKGINLQGGGLSAGALTDKDREDLMHGAREGAD